MKKSILFVEDDALTGTATKFQLEAEGFQVGWFTELKAARNHLETQSPDAVILDVGLPDGNGIDFCREIRSQYENVPILMLTLKTDEQVAVRALSAGATDYLRKPFGNSELVLKIRKLLKDVRHFLVGGLRIDLERREVEVEGQKIELTRREFDILHLFISRFGKVVSRESLLEIGGLESESSDLSLASHISRIRSKLKAAGSHLSLTSVYGVGYRLEASGQ